MTDSFKKLIFLLSLLSSYSVFCAELQSSFYQSPRGLLMGDAYSQLAEDESTLFYNPALLGRHSGFSFYPVNLDARLTNVLSETDRFEDFPEDDPILIANRVLDFPLYYRLGTVPGLKVGSFGLQAFALSRGNFLLNNQTTPFLNIDHTFDVGFAMGYAYNFGKTRKRNMKKKDYDNPGFGHGVSTSIGMTAKYIKREGINRSFPLLGTTLLNEIVGTADKDFYEIRSSLGYSKAKTWSFDLGFDQTYSTRATRFSWGVTVKNLGGPQFTLLEGEDNFPNLRQQIGVGAAYEMDFGLMGLDLSVEFRPINWDIPTLRKTHMGLRIDLPLVDILMGVSEGYQSYGIEVDLYAFRILAGYYSVELGIESKEYEGKRGLIYLSLLDFSFDA